MGERTQGLMHYNPNLSHQVDHAHAFQSSGFDITSSAFGDSHTHVISGPYFAYDQWVGHPRVLMIDRAWYGDPHNVALAWLNPDGTKRYASGTQPRPGPSYLPWKTREQSALILAGYQEDVTDLADRVRKRFPYVRVRKHPAERRAMPHDSVFSLTSELALSDVCVGGNTTALFESIRMGVPVICTDPRNECMPVCVPNLDDELYRGDISEWMHGMMYKQFSLHEIETGEAWEILNDESINETSHTDN